MTTRLLLLADTHLGEGQADRLIAKIDDQLARADMILHAGDVTNMSILGALREHAPVHAVLGNNDRGLRLPVRMAVDVDGCQIAMVHDSGPASGRGPRLRRWFPGADAVVFGHSHIPWHECDVRVGDGHVQHHVNPGSAMQRRSQPRCTVAWLHLDNGRVADVEHVAV
jgi:uncharacterized protein